MRRLLHTALGVWFLIVATMAQGCAGPAQSTRAYGQGEATSPANTNVNSPSQFAYATAPQNSTPARTPADTSGYVADPSASSALTDYLKHHRLPLVGAQVMRNPNNGARTVVLYGFVGSELGKSDAQRQAEDFINDAEVDVDNRIRVNPDLLAAGRSAVQPSTSDSSDDADDADDAQANASMPGAQAYVDQQNQAAQIQQYQQQSSMASMNSMLPLIALLGMLSMANSGGGFSTGPSMSFSPYSSPFGNSPYSNSPYGSPYSGYPPPNSGYPPSSTYGGHGYGPSGGGVTPFGSLPGSPYYSSP